MWGAGFGLEHPLWFQRPGEEPVEDVTFRRSNAFPVVAEECRAVRERVGLTECSNFAKYRVTGDGAAEWLQGLFTNRLPKVGPHRAHRRCSTRTGGSSASSPSPGRATTSSSCSGRRPPRSTTRAGSSPTCRRGSPIRFDVLGLRSSGCRSPGPRPRRPAVGDAESLATADFPFMTFRRIDVGMIPAWVGRMTYTGDLGYEIWVAPEHQRALFDLLWDAGRPHGMALFGFRALMSLRMEKMFGTWFREYRPIYTPLEAGMDRYLKLDHDFIGRAALEAEMARGPERSLVYLEIDPDPDEPADVIGDEPIWHDGRHVVGWVTSGAYAHYSAARWRSATCPPSSAPAAGRAPGFEVEIIGHRRPAACSTSRCSTRPGERMRA